MEKILFRSLVPLFVVALVVPSSSVAHAESRGEISPSVHNNEYIPKGDSGPTQLSKEPTERRAQLSKAGFAKSKERTELGYIVETYSKKDSSGITAEYDVIVPPTGPAPYINFEWDWGPRVYMAGAEFWSLGAAGFSGALCDYFSGHLAGAACSSATTALWNKVSGNNSVLNDQTCYDFSQALNMGWQVAPEGKCR